MLLIGNNSAFLIRFIFTVRFHQLPDPVSSAGQRTRAFFGIACINVSDLVIAEMIRNFNRGC